MKPARLAAAVAVTVVGALPIVGDAYTSSGHKWKTNSVPY